MHKCRTKKEEAAAAAAAAAADNQSSQIVQVSAGNSSKPKNRPVGSANTITADDSDGEGFWIVKEEVAHTYIYHAEPDPLLDDSESDDEWEDFHTELEGIEEHSE